MARQAKKEKHLRIKRRIELDQDKRAKLKAQIKDFSLSFDERMAARDKLNAMPRDGSKVRDHNRCSISGRPHGYIRRYGVSRIVFRELARSCLIPGVTKSSW